MGLYDNKWKKMRKVQRICMILSIICWICVIVPFLMDYTGVAAVVFFVENAWFIPFFFLCALGFTAGDFVLGYRLELHDKEERGQRVHRTKRR